MSDDILEIKKVTQVDALYQTKVKNMSQELKNKVDNFTTMQRKYAEYRSKGMRQADAAKKAGSTVKDRQALTRTGYNWEQVEGMKEYIAFLYQKRAESAVLDEIEIIDRVRAAVDRAMEIDRPDWAIKGVELMGNMIAAFDKQPNKQANKAKGASTSTNSEAFKNEGEEVGAEERMKNIQSLMNSIQKSKVYKDSGSSE